MLRHSHPSFYGNTPATSQGVRSHSKLSQGGTVISTSCGFHLGLHSKPSHFAEAPSPGKSSGSGEFLSLDNRGHTNIGNRLGLHFKKPSFTKARTSSSVGTTLSEVFL